MSLASKQTTRSSLPPWISAEAIADTRTVWEPIYGRPLNNEEIMEILFNAEGLLRFLFDLREPHAVGVTTSRHECNPGD
jgi:hypothetical protein